MEKHHGPDPELLGLLYDTLLDGLWDWPDITRPCFWWSPRYFEILGYRPGEVEATPETFFARVHPDDRTRLQADYQRHLQSPQGFTNEFRIVTPSGQLRWIFSAGKCFARTPGQPSRMVGIIRDITEQRIANDILRTSNQRFDEAIEATNDGLWELPDMATPNAWWSPRFYIQLGYQPGEIPSDMTSFFNLLHPDDLAQVQEHAARPVIPGQNVENAYRLRTKTGAYRWFLARGKVYPGAAGHGLRMVGTLRDITDLKRGEDKLRRSEAHHRALIQNLSVGVVVHAPDSQILYANPMACTLLGLSLEQMQGKHAMDPAWHFVRENGETVAPEDYPVSVVLRTGKPVRQFMAGIYRPSTQDRVWVLGNAYPEFDDQHQLQQVVVTFNDITAPLRMEIRLAQAQSVLAQVQDEVFWAAPSGLILYANPAACQKLGYTLEELCQLKVSDVDAEATAESWAAQWEVLQRERSKRFEGWHRAKDGTIYPVEIWSTFIENKGEPYACGIVRDITERRRIETTLRASEAKYRQLHESMRDAYARGDLEGRMLECNRAFSSLTGFSEAEMLAMTYKDFTPVQWHAMEEKILREQVFQRGYSDVYEKEYLRKDGTPMAVELRVFLIRNEQGLPTGMWAIVRDIAERKRNEAALARAHAELEFRVQERTTELQRSNELLRALTTKLTVDEDAERLRIARLVHDSFIQTLSLAHIRLGAIGNTLTKSRRPEVVHQLETVRALIKDAIGQSRNIVSDLAPPHLYQLGLVPALDDLALRLGGQHKIKISIIADNPLPDLDAGLRGLLFQSIRELMINAIKHAKGSNIDVELNQKEHWLRATVTDQGGRGARTKQRRRGITPEKGFGLFHIQQRLAGLGGELDFVSKPGAGTSVCLSVPLAKPAPAPARPAARRAKTPGTRKPGRRKKPSS
jgi:PAS domain S-box-containing protein